MLVIAIVAAFLSKFPRAMPVIVIVVVVVFSDELSNEKLHWFVGIRPERRYVRDCMINLADVLVTLAFRVAKRAQGDAASGNEAASEGASRKTSEVHKQAPYGVSKIAYCGASFASVEPPDQCTAAQTFIIRKSPRLQWDKSRSH
jgi:hypothetical protein